MEEKVMKITPLFDYVLSVQESSRCPLQAGKAIEYDGRQLVYMFT